MSMPDNPRILEISILDKLPLDLVTKAVDFFNLNYPNDSKKQMDLGFFLSKLGDSNPNGHGYFTVATFEGGVVGTCTAVRKTLISGTQTLNAVEIGDTFTSEKFRKSCYFSQLYPGTTSTSAYLNKSIFGRLATETLDRARADGVEYVYGTPNLQAKLSWLGRMNFKLVDGNFTYRINSANITHSFYTSSRAIHVFGLVYTKLTFFLCLIATKKYSVSLISKHDLYEFPLTKIDTSHNNSLQLLNSSSWIQSRFINNTDKDYKIVKIVNRANNQPCGYLFFLESTRSDNFRLLILSKSLFFDEQIERLRIPISKVAASEFFNYENLSMWVDKRKNSIKYRAFFGFLSKALRVDIVGKSLTDEERELQLKDLYNFEYGDSDLA